MISTGFQANISMMFRFGQYGRVRKWFIMLLLSSLIIPASSLYAMSNEQPVDNGLPPCHQVQDHKQTTGKAHGANSCCDTVHQCNGNCDHDCSDCFSTVHVFGLISFAAEPQYSTRHHMIPVSLYHTGLTSTDLLRPPRQLV